MESPYSKFEQQRKELLTTRLQEDHKLVKDVESAKYVISLNGLEEERKRQAIADGNYRAAEDQLKINRQDLKKKHTEEMDSIQKRHTHDLLELNRQGKKNLDLLKVKCDNVHYQIFGEGIKKFSEIDIKLKLDMEKLTEKREEEDLTVKNLFWSVLQQTVGETPTTSRPKQNAPSSKPVLVTPVNRLSTTHPTTTTPSRFGTSGKSISPSRPRTHLRSVISPRSEKHVKLGDYTRPSKKLRPNNSSPPFTMKNPPASAIRADTIVVQHREAAIQPDIGFQVRYIRCDTPEVTISEWRLSEHEKEEMMLVKDNYNLRFRNIRGWIKGHDEWQLAPLRINILKYNSSMALVQISRLKSHIAGREMWIEFMNTAVLQDFLRFYRETWEHNLTTETPHLKLPVTADSRQDSRTSVWKERRRYLELDKEIANESEELGGPISTC